MGLDEGRHHPPVNPFQTSCSERVEERDACCAASGLDVDARVLWRSGSASRAGPPLLAAAPCRGGVHGVQSYCCRAAGHGVFRFSGAGGQRLRKGSKVKVHAYSRMHINRMLIFSRPYHVCVRHMIQYKLTYVYNVVYTRISRLAVESDRIRNRARGRPTALY